MNFCYSWNQITISDILNNFSQNQLNKKKPKIKRFLKILITGGSSGIGKSCSEALVDGGAKSCNSGRDKSAW